MAIGHCGTEGGINDTLAVPPALTRAGSLHCLVRLEVGARPMLAG